MHSGVKVTFLFTLESRAYIYHIISSIVMNFLILEPVCRKEILTCKQINFKYFKIVVYLIINISKKFINCSKTNSNRTKFHFYCSFKSKIRVSELSNQEFIRPVMYTQIPITTILKRLPSICLHVFFFSKKNCLKESVRYLISCNQKIITIVFSAIQ